MMVIISVNVKCFHALMFRITFLRLSSAAAPLFSLCLKLLVLAPVSLRPPPPDKAQSALIGWLIEGLIRLLLFVSGGTAAPDQNSGSGLDLSTGIIPAPYWCQVIRDPPTIVSIST